MSSFGGSEKFVLTYLRTSNDPEYLHAAQAGAREMALIDCLVELVNQGANRVYDVQKEVAKSADIGSIIFHWYHVKVEKEAFPERGYFTSSFSLTLNALASGEYLRNSQSGPYSGLVFLQSKNPSHPATVGPARYGFLGMWKRKGSFVPELIVAIACPLRASP